MSNLLITLTQKGWALPVLGALENGANARIYPLAKRLRASPISVQAAMDHLLELELITPNAGHGHPLRPEYIRTNKGRALGPLALEVLQKGEQLGIVSLLRKRWTLPIASALTEARTFSELRRTIVPVTDRALSISLKDMASAKLVRRKVIGRQRPPATLYLPTAQMIEISNPLVGFGAFA